MPFNTVFKAVSKLFSKPDVFKNLPTESKREGTTETSPGDLARSGYFSSHLWVTDPDRLATYRDIENMDDNDDIVRQALDTLADTATGFDQDEIESFFVYSDNDRVLEILDNLVRRISLKEQTWDIIRKMVKHGNEFREVVVDMDPMDGRFKIMRLKGDLPCYQFYANLDKFGNQNSTKPWVQKAEMNLAGKLVEFEPWQIIHWHYGRLDKKLAVPFLKSARRNWKRLQIVEDTMALARMIRAYLKLIHKVPIPDNATPEAVDDIIKKYKEKMSVKTFMNWLTGSISSLSNPLTVETDFYLPDDGTGRGDIQAVDPKNANLSNIDDVWYHLGRLICSVGVPRKYLNLSSESSSGLNQGNGDNEEKHFARKVRGIQTSFKHGLEFLFNVELILHGLDPTAKENDFKIGMAAVNGDDAYRDAQAENTRADAAKKWSEFYDVPDDFINKRFMRLTPYEQRQYGGEIKRRTEPNPALSKTPDLGGAPSGSRPGSNGPNGTVPGRQKRN
jgi:hypothetical protein